MKDNFSDSVYIIDSYGLIYRAYYALFNHPLTNLKGENISAVIIFFRNLKALISKYKPSFLVAAFDSRTKTFRHEMFPEYKATRQKTPDDLLAQVPWIEEILNALGIPVLRCDGFEADDIIATVAKKCKAENRCCRILSGDKDLLQLVSSSCQEMCPDKNNGGWEINGIEETVAKWGIGPEKILDFLSLTGDSADNVPGVKGVGEKTALKLLNEYGSLEEILSHDNEIKGALGEKIRSGKSDAEKSKQLITLCDTVPVQIDFNDFSTANLNWTKAGTLLKEYGALQVAKLYLAESAEQKDTELQKLQPSQEAETSAENSPETESSEENNLAIKKNQGNYKAVTNLQELTLFVDEIISSRKTVAFDTETDGLNTYEARLVGFSLSVEKGSGIYVPVILPGEMFAPETISKDNCLKQLERIFSNEDLTLIMHNGKFDLEVLKTNGLKCEIKCAVADTMIAAWLLNPDATGKSPYSLEYLAEKNLGLAGIEFNDIVPKGKTFADVELEQAFPYGAEDSDFTLQLWEIFKPKLKEKNLENLFYSMEMKLIPVLAEMELNGIHLDKNTLNEYSKELALKISETEKNIYEETGHEFNIASTRQLQTVLFEERKLTPGKKTKTGYSTDSAELESLKERTDDPLPAMILDYRSFTKLQSTYVETLPLLADENSRVHTSFLQTGTATGRLSSRDPNLQNIPVRDENGRRIRSAFTAENGSVLISADYSQIELVILAHLSGDKNLCGAFLDGTDVHKSTAALIYGISLDEVKPEQRRLAKTVNFGVMYGMSAFRLSNELGISRTEARDFIDRYFETYAQVKEFINSTVEKAQAEGYVETLMGRRRAVKDINSRNKLIQQAAQRIAVNTPIQGSAADIVKKAMLDVNAELKKTNSRVKMLLQVHDELIFECPDDEKSIDEAVMIIREKMENAVKLNVPLKVSIECGKNWGLFH